jgi:phosphate transport system substrate-binding protein
MAPHSSPEMLPATVLLCLVAACASAPRERPSGTIRYEGSSTVAVFLRAAEPVYSAARFEIDTRSESDGGEQAIFEGRVDLAGIARKPGPDVGRSDVAATLLGRDAIAVIVNATNPVANLSRSQLRRIFSGEVTNWKDCDGPDLPVRPFIVGTGSATREVFRRMVLDGASYSGCEEVRPDADIVTRVAGTPGSIGQISFSFLAGAEGVRAVAVDGQRPTVTNFAYPIYRPLYLLWRENSSPVVDAFLTWTQTDAGQSVVMRSFVGARVLASVRGTSERSRGGVLVVRTPTYPVYDGGINYYPHRPYEILDSGGELLRRVPNHRGQNDENPTRIDLPPGTYLIRAATASGKTAEFLVTIEAGKVTTLDVALLVGQGG